MKNNTRNMFALLLAVGFLSTSCSTIYFQNGSAKKSLQNSEWHHGGILRLVEFSDPVDMQSRCRGADWTTIKTERTFLNGLAGGVTFGIYDPWEVSFGCVKSASNAIAPVSPVMKSKKK